MSCKDFTFNHLEEIFRKAKDKGYKIVTCEDYFVNHKVYEGSKILINRVDIDLSCERAKKVCEIFNKLRIRGTFFVRLHAKEYNPFSFENYILLKYIQNFHHEIGLHSEVIDCSKIWDENDIWCMRKDIQILTTMLDRKIFGVCSHGGLTGFNNLDFWKNKELEDFNLLYEAYDPILFNNFYCSVLLLTGWKCYNNGSLVLNDNKCLCEHLEDNHPVIYSNIHPIKFFERHIYES